MPRSSVANCGHALGSLLLPFLFFFVFFFSSDASPLERDTCAPAQIPAEQVIGGESRVAAAKGSPAKTGSGFAMTRDRQENEIWRYSSAEPTQGSR